MMARVGEPRVYGVSALQALEGREGDNAALVDGSGMVEFEAGLEVFLTRADHAGLTRRIEQAERLAADIAQALAKPPEEQASPAAEIARLGALIQALEAATETQIRRCLDGQARATAGGGAIQTRFLQVALTNVRANLAKQDPADSFPAKYAKFASTRAEMARRECEAAFKGLAAEIEAPLLAESAQHAEGEARVQRAAGVVLQHVGSQLTALGGSGTTGAVPTIAPPPRLGGEGIPEKLAPPVEQLETLFNDASLLRAMDVQSKKSAFDSFLSLSFGGVAGVWVEFVTPRVEAICQEHWKAVDIARLVREALDQHSEATRARFEPVQKALRAASLELLATRERAAVHRDRAAAQQAQQVREAESLRLRLASIRAHLTA
jgi:hypothetical protein